MKTTGNTILITGAGTGMGLEAARRFSELGNTVLMLARNRERLEARAADLEHADTFACDITDEQQIEHLLEYVDEHHPQLNVAFLNAGVTNGYTLFGGEDAVAHAREEMTTNFISAVRLTHALEPRLAKTPEAAMIITTSGNAFAPDVGNPTYSATKAALHSYVQSMRLVLQRQQSTIRVFELMAPLVDSPFAEHVRSDGKVAPSEVITALIHGLEDDELELRVGVTEDLYQMLRRSPEEALMAVNALTGG